MSCYTGGRPHSYRRGPASVERLACECVSGPARRLGQLATHVVRSARRVWGLACCALS